MPPLIRLLAVAVLLSGLTACSDYQTGYGDGYNNRDPMTMLVLGRVAYGEGYREGRMQAFHDDWYAENKEDIEQGLSCPAVVMRLRPMKISERIGRQMSE